MELEDIFVSAHQALDAFLRCLKNAQILLKAQNVETKAVIDVKDLIKSPFVEAGCLSTTCQCLYDQLTVAKGHDGCDTP